MKEEGGKRIKTGPLARAGRCETYRRLRLRELLIGGYEDEMQGSEEEEIQKWDIVPEEDGYFK